LPHGFADGGRSQLEIGSHLFLAAAGQERLDDLAFSQLELGWRPRLAVAETDDEVSLSATEGSDLQLADEERLQPERCAPRGCGMHGRLPRGFMRQSVFFRHHGRHTAGLVPSRKHQNSS
jgi:hypothetical protein